MSGTCQATTASIGQCDCCDHGLFLRNIPGIGLPDECGSEATRRIFISKPGETAGHLVECCDECAAKIDATLH